MIASQTARIYIKVFPFSLKLNKGLLILINHVPLVSACSKPASRYINIFVATVKDFFYTLLKYVRG